MQQSQKENVRANARKADARRAVVFLVCSAIFFLQISYAAENKAHSTPRSNSQLSLTTQDVHLSCDRSLRDTKTGRVECFGNVYMRRPSELLTSDYAILDLKKEQLHAEGNIIYFTHEMVIYGAKMDYNFLTGTGSVEDARVESDKYQLLSERLEKVGENHFIAEDGEYTTCRDCPASWKLVGKKVDLTVEGYAYFNQVFIKINDASTLYLPYAIIPVKAKRQSGLLIPKIQLISSNGFTFVQPFYWAISRNADTTFSAGYYTLRGPKAELETRYVLTPRTKGQLNAFYLHDQLFIEPYQDRWAVQYTHNFVLPLQLEQKLAWLDASDRDYVRHFSGDIPGRGEYGLMSEASLSRSGRLLSSWVYANRIRNNLTPKLVGFDPNTVQVLPSVSLLTTDHRLLENVPLHWGISFNYTRFWRVAPSYDYLLPKGSTLTPDFFLPGVSPLRRTQRFNIAPELYYTIRLADVFEMVPSVQYRTFYYRFDKNVVGPTARGYLIAQNEISTTLERIYSEKLKHKFRPSFVYSNIPLIQEDKNHPFIQQLKTSGYQFDDHDIVPITSETQLYFVPLGNSLSYRLGNKFILKSDEPPYAYKKVADIITGQSVNFIEFRKPKDSRFPLSRFFTLASVDTTPVQATAEYYYYPYARASTYSLSTTYVFSKHTYRLLTYQRSMSLHYSYNQVTTHAHSIGGSVNFSWNDFFSTSTGIAYSFPSTVNNAETPGRILSINLGFRYQSPSQCYNLILTASRTIDNPTVAINFSVPVNLTGEGFVEIN